MIVSAKDIPSVKEFVLWATHTHTHTHTHIHTHTYTTVGSHSINVPHCSITPSLNQSKAWSKQHSVDILALQITIDHGTREEITSANKPRCTRLSAKIHRPNNRSAAQVKSSNCLYSRVKEDSDAAKSVCASKHTTNLLDSLCVPEQRGYPRRV